MNLDKFYAWWGEWFAQLAEVKQERRRRRDPVTGKGEGNWYPVGSEAPGYGAKDTHKEYVHLWRKDVQTWARDSYAVFEHAYWTAHEWLDARGLTAVADALRVEDQVLRVLHYLPHPTGDVGAAHKDFDLLTVNLPGTVPGLERVCPDCGNDPADRDFCSRCGENGWLLEESGVHVGEMLEIYTGEFGARAELSEGWETLTADLHRVRTAPNADRIKAVFFVLPPMDFVLRPAHDLACWACKGSGEVGRVVLETCSRCGGSGAPQSFTTFDYLLGPGGALVKAGAK